MSVAVRKPARGTERRAGARALGGRVVQARNGDKREQLSGIQSARIIRAMCDICVEKGIGSVSVGDVVERAGVSRRTFYELFTDRDDCFLAAFQTILHSAAERVLPAYQAEKGWRKQVRAGLIALLGFLDEQSVNARVLIVESAGTGGAVLERRGEVIASLTSAIEQGAREAKIAPAPLTGEGVVGGVLAVIASRLADPSAHRLVDLANPLMSMIVLPYLGAATAHKELERPVEKPNRIERSEQPLTNPFKDTGLRLSYRTLLVLTAIAEHPEASNRVIADTAEIKDQGQISKLLTRLQRAGLVTNTEQTPGKGAPNRWTLTETGQRVVATIHAHTEGYQKGAER